MRIRLFLIIALTTTLSVFAACGGSEADTDTTDAAAQEADAPTAAAAPTASEQTSPSGDVVPVEVAPCDLLTADEVQAATGLPVVEVRDEPPIDCVFDLGDDAGVEVWVTIEDGQGRFRGPANLFTQYMLREADGEAEGIAEVGERAVCCPFRTIAVDAGGGRFIAVLVNGGYGELAEPRDALVSLAQTAVDRLG